MKRFSTFCVLTLSLMLALPAGAHQVQLAPGDTAVELSILQSGPEGSLIRFELRRFEVEERLIDGEGYQQLSLDGYPLHYERGLPALPTIRESLRIPDDAAMTIQILEIETETLSGYRIAPSKGHILRNVDPALVSYSFADFYGEDAWYPTEQARLEMPYIMRDTRGIVMELNPFAFNPATETLRVVTAMTVAVVAAGPGRINVLENRPARPVAAFEQIYADHYLNGGGLADRYTSIPEMGSMLVIAYDAFVGAVQPFVDWKNQMGIPTTLVNVSAVGATGEQIKTYIQDLYDSEGLCFVQLVGDAAQVPYLIADGSASDPSYGFLAGSDFYPEVFVGRFSAENASQVTTQVERSVEYERDAQAGAAWYARGVGIGSAEGSGIGDDGEADWQHLDVIRGKLLDATYTLVDQIYETNGGSAADVTAALNAGRSIINYCGHGWLSGWVSTGFDNTAVNALANDNLLPFISSVACNTGEFQSGTCFGEAWLRATNGGEPSGAVGFYGSTISMSWAPPMAAQDETIDLMVADAKRTFGALSMNGSCQMIDEYGAEGENEMRHWTIFGDPSLRVRTATPVALAAEHFNTVDPLMGSFTVNTEPGNLAALSYQGAFIGSALADEDGVALIPIEYELPQPGDTVTLTVTGYNRIAYVEELLVGDGLVPTCEATPASFHKIMLPDQIQTDWLHIANNGESGSTLWYSIDLSDPNYPVADGGIGARNMTGSTAWMDPDAVYPGSAIDLTVFAQNGSSDSEWIYRFEMDLPAGVTLNSAGTMTGGSQGDIPYVGVFGDGVLCEWDNGGSSQGGAIVGGETGQATVNLSFESIADQVLIPYTIFGDNYGGAPHTVSGEIVISTLGPNVTVLAPNGGEICPIGELMQIEWAAGGGPTLVDIELSRDGSSWEILAEDVFAATGSYGWMASGEITAAARVRVSDAVDPAVTDTSDEPFTIYRAMTWVGMSQFAGAIPQGENESLAVQFDSNGLPEGTYETLITISSNAGAAVVVPAMVVVVIDPTGAETAPAALSLAQNHPNPFNPSTVISFALPAAGATTLNVYDVEGRLVSTLIDESLPAGSHHVVWDGSDEAGKAVASGVYFYRVDAGEMSRTRKMLLLK